MTDQELKDFYEWWDTLNEGESMSNNIRHETIQAIYQHIHYNRDEIKAGEVLDKFLEDRTATLNAKITEQQMAIEELSKWVREGQATHTEQLAKISMLEASLQECIGHIQEETRDQIIAVDRAKLLLKKEES